MAKNNQPHCQLCSTLISENKRRAEPHAFLTSVKAEHFKPAMVAGYSVTTYKCSQCNNEITHMDDKNDSLHWYA